MALDLPGLPPGSLAGVKTPWILCLERIRLGSSTLDPGLDIILSCIPPGPGSRLARVVEQTLPDGSRTPMGRYDVVCRTHALRSCLEGLSLVRPCWTR